MTKRTVFTGLIALVLICVGVAFYWPGEAPRAPTSISETPASNEPATQWHEPTPNPRVMHQPDATIVAEPATVLSLTAWQQERALQEQRLEELAAQIALEEPGSAQFERLADQIDAQVKLMGMTRFATKGYEISIRLNDPDEIIGRMKSLDREAQMEFQDQIALLEKMASNRREILNQADSPDLLERFYKMQAQEMLDWDSLRSTGIYEKLYEQRGY